MANLDELLREAMNKLNVLKNEAHERLDSIETEKENYIDMNRSYLDSIDTFQEQPVIIIDIPKENMPYIKKISDLLDEYKCEYEKIKNVLDYDTDKNLNDFFKSVELLQNINPDDLLRRIKEATETCDKKFLVVTREIENVNLRLNKAKQLVETSLRSGSYMVSKTNYRNLRKRSDLLKNQRGKAIVKDIKDLIRLNKSFFDKTITYLESSMTFLNSPTVNDDLYNKEMEKIESKKDEINAKISEYNSQIDISKKNVILIDKIYKLYDQYIQTKNENLLNDLLSELSNFKLISQRNIKLTTYEKEDIPVEEVDEEKPVIEDKPINVNIPKVLDNDYFRFPDTKCIVCFLGDEDDTIKKDIEKHFDNSNRKSVLDELNSIFTSLALYEDYIRDKGSKPWNKSVKKTQALLKAPFDFEYRRYGVSRDCFRIHAITRYSTLLQELGYGSGKIMFFGAVGVNDCKEKTDAYKRLGSRAIEQLSNNGDVHILRPNFDYIEHITRGYIPVSLLSENDKELKKNGKFSGLHKGCIERAIEHSKYILYDALDDTSKENVKKYLDDYFIKQTTMLFNLLKDYAKDNSNNQTYNYIYKE